MLVTGAAGQLGGYLRPALEAAGAVAVGVGRRAGPGVDLVADLADAGAVREMIGDARPEAIVHAAAWTNVDGAEADPAGARLGNAVAAANVAAAARAVGSYLVAVSTDFVFSGRGGPYAEDDAPDPLSVYGRTKLEAERTVLAADAGFAVTRTAWLYGGPGKHFPRTVVNVLRARGRMEVVADEVGSPTFAGDLVAALVALVAARLDPDRDPAATAGVFHLVNAGRASRWELARAVAARAGLDPEAVVPVSTAEFLAKYPLPAPRPANSELLNRRAAVLGIVLRPWRDALAAYVPLLAAEEARRGDSGGP